MLAGKYPIAMVSDLDNKIVKEVVNAALVNVEGFEILIHRVWNNPSLWTASERITGAALVNEDGYPTSQAALNEARRVIRKVGNTKMLLSIRKTVAKGKAVYLAGWLNMEGACRGL